jgi:hypothetical protein
VFGVVPNLIVWKEYRLDEKQKQLPKATESEPKPKYTIPQIKVLTEEEVLSAFQVTAAGTNMWWT